MKLRNIRRHLVVLCALVGLVPAEAAMNGFDCTMATINTGLIRSGGPAKDGIPALSNPAFIGAGQASYLRPKDQVIGVVLNGDAKAYPLRILNWHEAVNDVVGGRNVLVTYCPLCRSALVFDRNVGGQVREFGVSGLLYNSNVLLYDRQHRSWKESLWSQGEMRAVTGPAAKQNLTLALLPAELTSWRDWQERHPGTRVLSDNTGHDRPYSMRDSYSNYHSADHIAYPVDKKVRRPSGFRKKEFLAVVYDGNRAKAYAVRDVAAAARRGRVIEDTVGSRRIRVIHVPDGKSVRIEPIDGGPPLPVAYMYWFAMSAMQPHAELYR